MLNAVDEVRNHMEAFSKNGSFTPPVSPTHTMQSIKAQTLKMSCGPFYQDNHGMLCHTKRRAKKKTKRESKTSGIGMKYPSSSTSQETNRYSFSYTLQHISNFACNIQHISEE